VPVTLNVSDTPSSLPAEPALISLGLSPAYPNPFNPTTRIEFVLPGETAMRLAIHDAGGRLVRLLAEGSLTAGRHAIDWDGKDGQGRALAAGVYLCRLEAGGQTCSAKLVMVE
jgi:hypothetical protein